MAAEKGFFLAPDKRGTGGCCLSPPDVTSGTFLVRLELYPDGLTSSLSLSPSLFQIVRKVVRQVDSSSAVDTQQLEEVIVEGPLADPGELEADIESFMTLTKVPRSRRPLVAAASSPLAQLCSAAVCNAVLWFLSGGWRSHLLLTVPFHPLPMFARLPM